MSDPAAASTSLVGVPVPVAAPVAVPEVQVPITDPNIQVRTDFRLLSATDSLYLAYRLGKWRLRFARLRLKHARLRLKYARLSLSMCTSRQTRQNRSPLGVFL
jgi:hypothetical protein